MDFTQPYYLRIYQTLTWLWVHWSQCLGDIVHMILECRDTKLWPDSFVHGCITMSPVCTLKGAITRGNYKAILIHFCCRGLTMVCQDFISRYHCNLLLYQNNLRFKSSSVLLTFLNAIRKHPPPGWTACWISKRSHEGSLKLQRLLLLLLPLLLFIIIVDIANLSSSVYCLCTCHLGI
jgi:hypothetical protein